VADYQDGILDRFAWASAEFSWRLRLVEPDHWELPTPCPAWDVRRLVNHVTRGNLNYVELLNGATREEFLRLRGADAVGADPAGAYARSARECALAFARPGALDQVLDYPLGQVAGQQALAVRTTDTVIHTWDLARAIGGDDILSPDLVTWASDHLDAIFDGLAESPVAATSTHQFFAAPSGELLVGTSRQDRLLQQMGRHPGH
jgi:uncharacterized protein (TIGR03086 family)